MTKFYIALTVILVAVFGSILYITQGDSIKKSLMSPEGGIPTLPPEASALRVISSQQPGEDQSSPQGQAQQQTSAPTYGVEEGVKASYSATIKTSRGTIRLTLFGKDAPNTVKNFLNKSKNGYYTNLTFHRVEDWVIQGGDPKGNGTGGGLMQTEINQLPFVEGSLGVARGADIRVSNDSQFFITKTESSHLNGQYTNFGQVTEGMNVVNSMKIGDKILGITIE
jgi:peptidyl-prolyl cis-trans isomerase B (cyclophilin B)